ncbi:MAG: AraC family transcriptional regulator [Bacteroidales bacterium]|nr:AraC family transcriptional regulator [Bacteroidales bacterium]
MIKSRANTFLGILMILVSVFYFFNAQFVLAPLKLTSVSPYFIFSLLLVVNPFYYFYTRSLTVENYKFGRLDLLHFAPGFLFIPLSVITFSVDVELISPAFLKSSATAIYNGQVLIYAIMMIILLKKHHVNLKNYFSFQESINLNWLKVFVVIYILISAIDLVIFHLHEFEYYQSFYFILMVLFFNFLGYFGIRQNSIYEYSLIESEKGEEGIKERTAKIDEKFSKQVLPDEKKEKLMLEILDLMEKKKMYLNPKLTIYDISDELNVNKTYISLVINDNLQENFNNFINRYRVNEAKKLLISPDYQNLTIEGIANMVGFYSKTAFNSAFKKITLTTPSEFKNSK